MKKKVLVVEDYGVISDVITRLFHSFGLDTDTAQDGIIALNKLKIIRYDLVVSDIEMPNMNGLEMLYSFRNFDKTTPVIMLSTVSDEQIIRKTAKLGANGYMQKPYTVDKVQKMLQRFKLLN